MTKEGNLDWTQSGMPHISLQDCMLVFTGSLVVVARGLQRNACSVIPGHVKSTSQQLESELIRNSASCC